MIETFTVKLLTLMLAGSITVGAAGNVEGFKAGVYTPRDYTETAVEIVKTLQESGVTYYEENSTRDDLDVLLKLVKNVAWGISVGENPKVAAGLVLVWGNDQSVDNELHMQFRLEHKLDKRVTENKEVKAEIKKLKDLESWEEQVKEIARWCSKAEYKNDGSDDMGQAIGVLNGHCVCSGYANMASYLLEECGIPNVKVESVKDSDGETHQWNVVRDPNGGTENLSVDITRYHSGDKKYMLTSEEEYEQLFNVQMSADYLFDAKYRT